MLRQAQHDSPAIPPWAQYDSTADLLNNASAQCFVRLSMTTLLPSRCSDNHRDDEGSLSRSNRKLKGWTTMPNFLSCHAEPDEAWDNDAPALFFVRLSDGSKNSFGEFFEQHDSPAIPLLTQHDSAADLLNNASAQCFVRLSMTTLLQSRCSDNHRDDEGSLSRSNRKLQGWKTMPNFLSCQAGHDNAFTIALSR